MLPLLLSLALAPDNAAPPPHEAGRFSRWEKEITGIEKRLKGAPPAAGGVVFAGSSSTRLWSLEKSFPGKGYVNVGFGGSEVRDSTHFAARTILPLQPSVIVFYAGDNDVASGRTPQQVHADFKAFCATVHKDLPKCRILFIAIKPSIARWKRFDDQQKANALVKDLCAADPRLTFVDIVPLMLGADGKPVPALYAKDGLHLSPVGYEKWAAEVKKALQKD